MAKLGAASRHQVNGRNGGGGSEGVRRAASRAVEHTVKRGVVERMKRIFGLRQDGRYPNCGSIAAELEVSVKTAGRDVEFMRDRLNLPIEYAISLFQAGWRRGWRDWWR